MASIPDIIRINGTLKSARTGHDAWWDSLSEFFLPQRSPQRLKTMAAIPDGSRFDRVFDTTAIQACEGLANMFTSQLTPAGQDWISYAPPAPFNQDEEIVDYYQDSSKSILGHVLNSNFYTEKHEANLDKVGMGTGCTFLRKGRSTLYQFQHVDIGTYCFTEDADGRPNQIFREVEMTADQAAESFPTLSPTLSKDYADLDKRYVNKHTIIHYVGPNPDFNEDKLEAKYKRFISRWIHPEDKAELDQGGFDYFPYEISRMVKWSSSDPWGLAPGRKAISDIHQVNWLSYLADMAAELLVRPRHLTLADQVGQVDLRAGGRTVVTAEASQAQLPREWMTSSRGDFADQRVKEKQASIQAMFFQPLHQTLSQIDRPMTAYEVGAREREQLSLFASTIPARNRFPAPTLSTLRHRPGGGSHPRPARQTPPRDRPRYSRPRRYHSIAPCQDGAGPPDQRL